MFGTWGDRHIRMQPTSRQNDAGILIFNRSPPAAGDKPRGSSVPSLRNADVQRLPSDADKRGWVLKLSRDDYDETCTLRSV